LIYLEAGSGARLLVPVEMIELIAQNIEIPLIVGGGIVDLRDIQKPIMPRRFGRDRTAFENDDFFFK
jgi:putative glycerol-1-phosphate prenyltransferase